MRSPTVADSRVPYVAFIVLQQVYTTSGVDHHRWRKYEHRHRLGGPREEAGIRPLPGPAEGRPKPSAPDRRPAAAAGILLRLGQPDVFGADGLGWDKVAAVFATAGGAIFDNLPMLFCIGVAIGFAKKADGSTALAALVGFLVYSNVLKAFPVTEAKVQDGADIAATYNNPGVLGGILMGLLAAVLWQRYHRKKLVDWLGFFNGRRLVPIIMAFVGTLVGVFFGLVWEPIGNLISDSRRVDHRSGRRGRGSVRSDQPRADPHRHAPVREHRLLVPDR